MKNTITPAVAEITILRKNLNTKTKEGLKEIAREVLATLSPPDLYEDALNSSLVMGGEDYFLYGPQSILKRLKAERPRVVIFGDYLAYASTLVVLKTVLAEYRAEGFIFLSIFIAPGSEDSITLKPNFK